VLFTNLECYFARKSDNLQKKLDPFNITVVLQFFMTKPNTLHKNCDRNNVISSAVFSN